MQKNIERARKYLEWEKPAQAIAELKPTLGSDQIQQKFKWVPHHMMGIALSQQGDHEASARYMQRALDVGSEEPETYHMLSVNYFNLAEFEKAEQYGKMAVEKKDDFLKAWLNIGSIYQAQAKLEEALRCFKKVNQLDSTNADVAFRIGKIYHNLGDRDKAHQLFDFTLKMDEGHAQAFFAKASLYKEKGDLEKAREYIEEARERYGQETAADVESANIHRLEGDYDKALSLYKKVVDKVKTDNQRAMARNNYALCLKEVTYFDESEKQYRQAIREMPERRNTISNYLMALHYNPKNDKEFIFDEHRRLGKVFKPPQQTERTVPSDTSKDKKLKVGFISGGFRGHPVGFMVAGALEQFSGEQFEVFCYTVNNKYDFITRRIHQKIDHWRSAVGYNPEVVAKLIREDEIDILVDLAGHAKYCQFEAMARKPAPIIVKWVGGLFNTTGIEAFDYLISDWYESPEGEEKYYTEKLVRLPDDYISYAPPAYMPDVVALPAEENDYITFGCFNNPTKVNEVVLKQWAKIMRNVPQSRLYLKSKQYDTASFRERIIKIMEDHGISEDRIRFAGKTDHGPHLEEYNTLDIALDPWPYSGGLTTCEALYMGVPVITMSGPTFAGRHSTTHLINAGLEEFVTDSWEEYTEKTIALAKDRKRLKKLRSTLRDQLRNSPVCDGKRLGAHLSVALRTMWEQWVEGYENNLEEWQNHISVEPLSDAEINELTDGPEQTPLIEKKTRKKNKETDTTEEKQDNVQDSNTLDTNSDSKAEKSTLTSVGDKRMPKHSKNGSRKNKYNIKTNDGLTICTPANLDLLTSYVLLEQGQWLEQELNFARKYLEPGMQVIDAGAGFGAYTLPMAKQVGADGKVYAFEPGSRMKRYLEMSKEQNGFDQIEIIRQGLGAKAGKGYLTNEKTPEFNYVADEGEEEVSLTTLDAWWSFAGRPELDLLKIDVNGMEGDLLKGAAKVLNETDPVIITSIGEDEKKQEALEEQLRELGYRLFEYIPSPQLLADFEGGLNVYRMNVVAVKEQRIDELKKKGWIFNEEIAPAEPNEDAWERMLEKRSWAASNINKWKEQVASGDHTEYLQILNMICEAEQMEVSAEDPQSRSRKGATLLAAARKLIGLFNGGKAGVAAAMTYVRVMNMLGKKVQAVEMMKELVKTANSEDDFSLQLPFLPPLAEQDDINIETEFNNWLTVRIVEAWIMLKDPTTYISGEQERKMLKVLEGNPESSPKLKKCIGLVNKDEQAVLAEKPEAGNGLENEAPQKKEGIQIVEEVNTDNDNNLPSQLVKTRIQFNYLNDGKPFHFLIPRRELFRLKNIFIDHEYSLPRGFEVPDNGTIVDIGANIGTFALYARKWNKNAHIYSFEPNPQVVPLLKPNTKDVQNITKEFVALGESNGELTLMQHPVNTGQSSTSQKIKGAKEVTIQVRKAGEALEKKGVSAIDVLKIDTEGAEVSILKGMKNLLSNTKVIMLEYHTEEDRREIDALLSEFSLYSSEVAVMNKVGTVKYVNKKLLR